MSESRSNESCSSLKCENIGYGGWCENGESLGTAGDFRSAFKSRDFRLYQTARLMVILGAEAQSVAVAWQVYALTHSALDLGYTGLALVSAGAVVYAGGGACGGSVRPAKDHPALLWAAGGVYGGAAVAFAERNGADEVGGYGRSTRCWWGLGWAGPLAGRRRARCCPAWCRRNIS